MTPADEVAELLRDFSEAEKGSVFPFRSAAAVLLAEYDRRLHEGSTVAVHIGKQRLEGVVKTLGNAAGPLVVVVAAHGAIPQPTVQETPSSRPARWCPTCKCNVGTATYLDAYVDEKTERVCHTRCGTALTDEDVAGWTKYTPVEESDGELAHTDGFV